MAWCGTKLNPDQEAKGVGKGGRRPSRTAGSRTERQSQGPQGTPHLPLGPTPEARLQVEERVGKVGGRTGGRSGRRRAGTAPLPIAEGAHLPRARIWRGSTPVFVHPWTTGRGPQRESEAHGVRGEQWEATLGAQSPCLAPSENRGAQQPCLGSGEEPPAFGQAQAQFLQEGWSSRGPLGAHLVRQMFMHTQGLVT